MKTISHIFKGVILAVPFLIGCGGDDDDDDFGTNANIVELTVDPSVVVPGQGSVVHAKFSFSSSDALDANDDVELVIALPPQLAYRPGTAEIQRPIDDNDINPSQELVCADGSSFLRFNLGRSELIDAENPSGDGDAELTLTVDVRAGAGATTIAATASDDAIGFSCAGGIPAQASAAVVVQG